MNKREFLDLTRYYLKARDIGDEDIKEIVKDFEEHFNIGIEEGRTQEEICESLGNPKEIASTYEPNRKSEALYYDKSDILNKDFNISGIDTLTYELNVGNAEIYPSDDENIHVKLLVDSDEYMEEAYARINGDVLNIKATVKKSSILYSQKCILRLYIPETSDVNVIGKVEAGSGYMGDLRTNHLSAIVKTGDIQGNNIISRSFIADSKAGYIKLRNIKSNIRTTVKTGDIKCTNISCDDIMDFKASIGSVKVDGVYGNIRAEIKTGDFMLVDNSYKYDADIIVKTGNIKMTLGDRGKG